jgi:RNA polymerase sigma factor (TIGR02999 family)
MRRFGPDRLKPAIPRVLARRGQWWQNVGTEESVVTDAPPPAGPPDPAGQPGSSAELLPQVYEELRRLARARIAREPAGLTLQPTALVHEAYLRLAGNGVDRRWDKRGHFFGAAAIAMRRILVERARHYRRVKHGGEQQRVELDRDAPGDAPAIHDVIAIDQALTRLEAIDPGKARIVLLRYFAGLTIEETAAAMDLSPATVKTEWAFARAWLQDVLRHAAAPPDGPET